MTDTALPSRIPSIRLSPERQAFSKQLGLLGDLTGTWEDRGFNLSPGRKSKEAVPSFLNSIKYRKP